MAVPAEAETASEGRLAGNIGQFARALRRAGIGIGPGQLASALEAVAAGALSRREDLHAALRASLVTRHSQFETFDALFDLFWQVPDMTAKMMEMMLPALAAPRPEARPKAGERRAREALAEPHRPVAPQRAEQQELQLEARFTVSEVERLRHKDFEQMSAGELAEAKVALARLTLPAPPLPSRRLTASPHGGRPDMRAMLRRALRRGGELDRPMLRQAASRPPNLVVLCDISGSMASYARVLMHFLHGLASRSGPGSGTGWSKTHAFTFGTRLTNVTRALSARDIDTALASVGREVSDWEGGTRIGAALHRFNRDWSRRVLGQGAVVLLITDGLERGDAGQLSQQAERLALSCRRLIWLNPLLRWEGFAPEAAGIKALLPHVGAHLPCHSLASVADLAQTLGRTLARVPPRQGS